MCQGSCYIYTVDALSKAPISSVTLTEDDSLQEDAELFVATVVFFLASLQRMNRGIRESSEGNITTRDGQQKKQLNQMYIKPYWAVQSSLTVGNNLLLHIQ